MLLINTPLPLDTVKELDRAARLTGNTRTELIQQAVSCFLQDFDDQEASLGRIHESVGLDIDWDEVATYFRD
jgi:metal-responsive CopG/Arc/MetJ family transcriptional regulator